MDFLSLEESKSGYSNILVMTDHFTKIALVCPIRKQEAKTVVKILFGQFILHYGIPECLHGDKISHIQFPEIPKPTSVHGLVISKSGAMEPLWVTSPHDILPQHMVDVLEETIQDARLDDEDIVLPGMTEDSDDYANGYETG